MDDALNVDPDEWLRRILAIHFDPQGGAPYWLRRQRELGIDVRAEIRTLADLDRLGTMDADTLRGRSVLEFVPRSRRGFLAGAILTETGGTTGRPQRTLFSPDEFRRAFVDPFVRVAQATDFPREALWLWAGPSGPHVIGQAAAACAAALGSPQPLSIDFDPRWYRRLPHDSMARQRYLEHLIDQALDVLRTEPVSVLFTTPAMLQRLAHAMTDAQRRRIRGVHYGGMRVEPALLHAAQTDWFPQAVHLAGYGNSLFGLCMEFGGPADRTLRYYPLGPRHQVRVGQDGHVYVTRLDPTVLLVRVRERDVARPLPPPGAPWEGFGAGIEDPHPPDEQTATAAIGIY